ncbi:MAG: CHAD domain-containing protein [Verrucomicrobium sp.]|nr:CHAD domain-containing protein [Verrucomicrobium sp.]
MIARQHSTDDTAAAPPEAAVWLKRLLVHMASLAERDIERVPDYPDTSIHALRKRMKKVLALLRLARPAMTGDQFSNLKAAIRQLKRLVATQRDQQVMAQLEHDLQLTDRRQQQQSSRSRPRKTVRALSISEGTCEQLTLQASSLTDRLGRLRLFSLSWESVAEAYVKTYRRGHKACKRSEENPTMESLHEWRKSVKDHYYQTLALYVWLGHPRRLRRTRRLSSLLGRAHDLDVYTKAREIDEPTQELLEEKRGKLLNKIFKKGARVYAKSSDHMAEVVKKNLPE